MGGGKPSEIEAWVIEDVEVGERVQGQFPPLDISEEIGVTYGESYTLNRQSAILQFLHGNARTISFTGRLFAAHRLEDITKPLQILQAWAKRDIQQERPRTLIFWVGDGTLAMRCVLESLSDITYRTFRNDGSPRDIVFTVNLLEYVPFSLAEMESDTRWHRARLHDYYEWLAQREYGDPMKGVIVRNDHPTKRVLQPGEVVKLPSPAKMLGRVAEPVSVSLEGAFDREESPQRTLRIAIFDRRNRDYVSHTTGG